jgi:hypothetical protein
MSLNPFAPTTDYPSMLNKIAVYTFAVGIAMTWVLRSQIAPIEAFLDKFDLAFEIEGNKIALGFLLPAFLVALLFRIVKMHDRLSDVTKTREEFDLNEILVPLSIGSGFPITIAMRDRALAARDRLMTAVFYTYASSTAGKAKIDSHLVTMALDQWSWFWIGAEAVLVIAATGAILAAYGKYQAATWAFIACFLVFTLQHFTRRRRANYAHAQVEAILTDAVRRNEIAGVFRAL